MVSGERSSATASYIVWSDGVVLQQDDAHDEHR
jgi:hypothetical protein